MYSTPPKVLRLPKFPKLTEDNIRKGFLEDAQYEKLIGYCPDAWFRTLVEMGRTYGWRISELVNLKVRQVDILESLPDRSGWLTCSRFTISGFETEDHILLAGVPR